MSLSRKQEIILTSLGELNEGTLARVGERRMHGILALQRKKRRVAWISVGAGAVAAAILLLLLLAPLLTLPDAGGGGAGGAGGIPTPGKQVPIYRGMSISSTAPTRGTAAAAAERILLSASEALPYAADGAVESAVADRLQIVGGAEGYFVPKNSDVYITVHLDNPDDFEIVSFTLGGVKYTDYMFEDGSDMENIVIKRSVGDVEGTLALTIDAIKYIDGTEIRDVRMEGERTVRVTVTPDAQPTAALTLSAAPDRIYADVESSDPLSLIGSASPEGIWLFLFADGRILAEEKLSLGEEHVTLTGLREQTEYEVVTVAVYDALDGAGVSVHILARQRIGTPALFTLSDCVLVGNVLRFFVEVHPDLAATLPLTVELWQGETLICTLPSDARRIEGLAENTDYTLSVSAPDGDGVTKKTYDFTTGAAVAVSLETNGGEPLASLTPSAELPLPTPTRQGYTFGGWFADAALTNRVSEMPTVTCTLYAYWTEETPAHLLIYREEVTGVTLLGVGEAGETLSVPAYVGGIPVTAIGERALAGLGATRAVRLPETLTEIGDGAFADCAALETLSIPESVVRVGKDAFAGCDGLVERIDGISYVGAWAVGAHNVTRGDGEVPRPLALLAGTRGVADALLAGVRGIGTVLLPGGTLYLGADALAAEGLLAAVLPASLRFVGRGALASATGTAVYFAGESDAWSRICVKGALGENGSDPDRVRVLAQPWEDGGADGLLLLRVGKEEAVLLCATDRTRTSYTFPETARRFEIAPYAFAGCTALEALSLPESLRSLGAYALAGCTALEELTVPAGATVDPLALTGTQIRRARVGGSVLPLIRASVETLCVTGGNVRGAEAYPQNDFPCLRELTLSSGVTVDARAFAECARLETVTLEGTKEIPKHAFAGCAALTSLSLSGTERIGAYAFAGCTSLSSAPLPDGLVALGEHAFEGCTAITSLRIPETLREVGDDALCGGVLEELTVPAGAAFDLSAFKLTGVKRATVPLQMLRLVKESVEELTLCGGTRGDIEYGLEDSVFPKLRTLTVTGMSALGGDVGVGVRLTFAACPLLETVVIGDGVKRLERDCFESCPRLRSVTLGEDLSVLSDDCFSRCPAIEEITVYPTLTHFGRKVFSEQTDAVTLVFMGTRAQWAASPLKSISAFKENVRCTDDE